MARLARLVGLRSADGVLVVHHDDTVDRTTNQTGPVGTRTYTELQDLGREQSAIVTSFDDQVLAAFHAAAPAVELSPGLSATAAFVLQGTPRPDGQRTLQVPLVYEGITVLTPDFVPDLSVPQTS
jgi:glycerophosphoryl diester phosphodiesterase